MKLLPLKSISKIIWFSGLIICCQLLMPVLCFSQEKQTYPSMSSHNIQIAPRSHADSVIDSEIDLKDVYRDLFKVKHLMPDVDSITGQPIFSFIPAIGYSLQSRLAIIFSGNIAFRTDANSHISTVTASTAYTQNKQFTIPIETNIWLFNNKYNLVGDYRFYKYPQSTFGLGSNSSIKNEDPMDYNFLRINEIVMRHISGDFYAGAGYGFDYHWNVTDKGILNGTVPDYLVYGAAETTISSGILLNALYDTRDNSINPLKGFYSSVQFKDNMHFLASSSNWQSLIIDTRAYLRFPSNSDNVLAFWSYDWLTLTGKPPYLDLPANSWDPYTGTGRGYIQGRFRGAQMVYLEAEYRYKITRNGLIGGVLFMNEESFSAEPGTKLQRAQPGFGPGIRVKLSKISRTNIAVDYGFGAQGSRGVFVNVGEVF